MKENTVLSTSQVCVRHSQQLVSVPRSDKPSAVRQVEPPSPATMPRAPAGTLQLDVGCSSPGVSSSQKHKASKVPLGTQVTSQCKSAT